MQIKKGIRQRRAEKRRNLLITDEARMHAGTRSERTKREKGGRRAW